ncbi:hypothetical protein V8G54_033622 [Vigna mungo]|uniref:Uncharacterized protein n=1 Tax=Vigna mungo TaxID=3915 RepID=A0AAQ3MPN6_VIGMU
MTKPNISPSEIGPDGRSKPLTQAEEMLNWQTENDKNGKGPHLVKLPMEIKKLKAQLHDLDHYIESKIKEKQSPFLDTLSPPPFTPYRPLFQPSSSTGHKSKQPYSLPTATAFRNKQKPRTSIPSVST